MGVGQRVVPVKGGDRASGEKDWEEERGPEAQEGMQEEGGLERDDFGR